VPDGLLLAEQRVFTTEQMIDAVETAIATKRQMIAEQQLPETAKVRIGSKRWQLKA
jgi:hypothetical protein